MFEFFIQFVRNYYSQIDDYIPLHSPVFRGNEKKYVIDAIDSTYVSSVGAYVDKFEEGLREVTGAKFAVATVNGTSALHASLHAMGIQSGDEVITQALSFVATANAISYSGAKPVFLDVDLDTLGLSPLALRRFLKKNVQLVDSKAINKLTNSQIKAIVPMHTFGIPCRIKEIVEIANEYNIIVIEDAAESLGSTSNLIHTGRFGKLGIFSFNGNKTLTSGGGGAIITDDVQLGKRLKHLTTTAKIPHQWEYNHDEIGYNYRMPNLNAALACGQLENLADFLIEKRALASKYIDLFNKSNIQVVRGLDGDDPNFWLNTILLNSKSERDEFLKYTNENKVMTRPAWNLLNTLPMYTNSISDSLENSYWLTDRLVNIPSGIKK